MWNVFSLQANKVKKERIEARLQDMESKMEEFKDLLPSEDAAKLKDQIQVFKEKLGNQDSTDSEEIKETVNDLLQQSLKLFEMARKQVK